MAVLPVAPALAGTVLIDEIGGAVFMESKNLTGSVFGGFASPTFDNGVLKSVHDDLAADGITTNAFVTFALVDTDSGLAFLTLVDDETLGSSPGFSGFNSILGLVTTADAAKSEFINDAGGDMTGMLSSPGQQTFGGEFKWDSAVRGDALAWAGLVKGDTLSFDFDEVLAPGADSDGSNGVETTANGLGGVDTFQFVSWVGGTWTIVATGNFSDAQQFSFTAKVIPLPTSASLALVGMLAAAGIRRRRSV